MANVSFVSGFKPVTYDPKSVREFNLPATDNTATFVGDPVKVAGGADADGRGTVDQCGASDASCGVVMGFVPRPAALDAVYRPASVSVNALVCTDENAVYEVQCTGALTAADIGLNIDATAGAGAGNTTSGASGYAVDSGAMDTTATRVYKILALVPRVDNEFGAYQKVLVKINNHQFGSHTGTAGV